MTETLPIQINEGDKRRSIRKEKLEEIRKDQSALRIQSVWRGNHVRGRRRSNTNLETPNFMPNEVVPIPSSSSRRRSSSFGAIPVVDDDEDEGNGRPTVDVDEENMENAAVIAEQSTIHAAQSSFRNILSDEYKPEASSKKTPITWPEPFVENFNDNWPNLSDDEASDKWVYQHKSILVRTVTWNLCAKKPPSIEDVRKKLLPPDKFHLYVIGSEECERSIAQSAVNTSKKNWEAYLTEALGSNYQPIRAQTLQAIHIIIFAHKSIAYLCSEVSSGAVPTGIGNTLGNKGGVAIQLTIGRTRAVFVNVHLAAHQNAVKQRNADFHKISNSIPYALRRRTATHRKTGIISRSSTQQTTIDDSNNTIQINSNPHMHRDSSTMSTASSGINGSKLATGFLWKPGSISRDVSLSADGNNTNNNNNAINQYLHDPTLPVNLTNYGDRVVFMGDMNYRIRGNRSAISKLIDMNMHEVMIHNDQLKWSINNHLAFDGFIEAPLHFKPTYKLDQNSDEYDTGFKRRIPAWTDRILYNERGLQCIAYDADMSLRTSDHRPVYASFKLQVDLYDEESNDTTPIVSGPEAANDSQAQDVLLQNTNISNPPSQSLPSRGSLRDIASQKPVSNPEFKSESAVCTIM